MANSIDMEEYKTQFPLDEVDFVVEATSFEQSCLWGQWHKEVRWEQVSTSDIITIGFGNSGGEELPIVLCLGYCWINGLLVMFYNSTSRLVDHCMVEDWLKERCKPTWDNDSRLAHTDAQNFHHFINHSRSAREKLKDGRVAVWIKEAVV